MTETWHDVTTWDDLALLLTGTWLSVHDRRSGLVLSTLFDDLLVDEPPDGTAAQRRGLHRRGFRRRGDRCWSWRPPEPSPGELQLPPTPLTGRVAVAWQAMEREAALDRARAAEALHVLREVYGCSPTELEVRVVSDDPWDDGWHEEEDDDALPALDCAALEALYGPPREFR